jgi:O-antigen/teichoic acid export membrane protein
LVVDCCPSSKSISNETPVSSKKAKERMMNDEKIDKEDLTKTVSRNSVFTVIYNVWYLGSRLVLTPIILSYVTIEEYGLWSYCFVVLSYLALTAFGFNSTYIRYAADYRSRKENDKLNELISTGLITMLSFSIVLFSFFYFLVPWLLNLLGIDSGLHQTARGLLLGTAAIFVLNFSLAGFQYILEGEQRIALVRQIHLVASVIEIALIIIFFENDLGVYSLLWAYAVRLAFTIILCTFFAFRVFPFLHVSYKLYRKEALKAFTGFGNQMNLLGLLSLLINSADRIFITRILHLEAVGMYEIGRKLPNIGLMLPSAIAGTLMPAASYLEGSSQHDRLKRLYLSSTRYLMMLSSIPYAFLIFFAPQIIEVWVGQGYHMSIHVMQILAIGTFINLFTGIGTACVRGIGKPKYEIKYMTISAILILTLSVPLIKKLGITGAAWAYCIGQTVGSLYFLRLANRLFEVSWMRFLQKVLPPVLLMFGIGLPAKVLCHVLWVAGEPSRWLKLGIVIVVGLFYVILSLLVFNIFQKYFFSEDERQKISSLPVPAPAGSIWKRLWRTT